MKKNISFFAVLMLLIVVAEAQVRFASAFGDNMVIKRLDTVEIWGYAGSSDEVAVVGSWNEKDTIRTITDRDSKWRVKLPTAQAGRGYRVTAISRHDRAILENVALGEVWLCSGQSNMQWTHNHGGLADAQKHIAEAVNKDIRIFTVRNSGARYPQENCDGRWEVCSPEVMRRSSAVAYFFAQKLNQELDVPIGLVVSAWGGSSAEVWVAQHVLDTNESLRADAAGIPADPWKPNHGGGCYNAMIAPLVPMAISGVIWYQGESNISRHANYDALMRSLITSWRADFKNDTLPFYYVQIAPFRYNKGIDAPCLREQQEMTLGLDATAMIVVSDLVPDVNNIHPANKIDVGARLANTALARIYGKNVEGYKSPRYVACHVIEKGRDKGAVQIELSDLDGGIIVRGEQVQGMQIAAYENGPYLPAKAKVVKDKLVVWNEQVKTPYAVRYCFDEATIGNVFNGAGLPVAPFRATCK